MHLTAPQSRIGITGAGLALLGAVVLAGGSVGTPTPASDYPDIEVGKNVALYFAVAQGDASDINAKAVAGEVVDVEDNWIQLKGRPGWWNMEQVYWYRLVEKAAPAGK